jgi:hypothetical protein
MFPPPHAVKRGDFHGRRGRDIAASQQLGAISACCEEVRGERMTARAKALGQGVAAAALGWAALALGTLPAQADKIKHPTAVFAGLDKITGRIISFDVATDETVQFGSLQITPRVCYTRPATEAPQTTTFVEVDDIGSAGEFKRIFSGWMFAASPGLHGVEHPVYDIWLTDCKGGKDVIATPPESADLRDEEPPAATPPKPGTTPRPRQARPVTPPPLPPSDASQPSGFGAPIEVGPPPGSGRSQQQQFTVPAPSRGGNNGGGFLPPADIPGVR